MSRMVVLVALSLFALLLLGAMAETQTEPSTDRSSAFVKGDVDPLEAFGAIEGPTLLILGLAALALIFVVLCIAKSVQSNNHKELSRIEKQILPKGDTNGW